MLYNIKSKSTTKLSHPFKEGNIIVFRFSNFDLEKKTGSTHSKLELQDDEGNTMLGIEQTGNNPFVAITSGGGDEKKAINWPERYPNKDNCNHSVAVYDHGSHFEILLDIRSAGLIDKPAGEPTKVFAEWTEKDHGESAKLELWDCMYNFLYHSDCQE